MRNNGLLLINPFGIGDVLFTTPLLHSIKDAYPDLRICYLCNSRSVSVLEGNPYIDKTIIYERDDFEAARKKSFFLWLKKYKDFINRIKEENFDIVLDLSLNTQYGFFCWCAGIPKRIGYDYKGRGRFLTQKIPLSGYQEKHIIEYYNDLLQYLDLQTRYKNPELYVKEEDKIKAGLILSQNGIKEGDRLVAVIPGGGKSWGKDAYLKHWPQDRFAELADKIIENYQAKIIIVGDFSEKEIVAGVISRMKQKAIDLSGSTSIRELAAVIQRADLVIANDGGPLHMAVALGRKTVSFFGPVDPKVYGPYPPDEKRHIVLGSKASCGPCYNNFRLKDCVSNRECLESIIVKDALGAVERLMR